MQEPGEVFSYTAKKGDYLSMAIAFVFIIVLEAIGVDLLLALLVQGSLKFILLAIALFFHLGAIAMLFATLWTKHRLTATQLRLRYGFLFKTNLQRPEIVAAAPVKEKLDSALNVSPFYNKEKHLLKLPLSTEGQVLLYLAKPKIFHFGFFKKGEAGQIIINVDRRDLFLQQLALPVKPDFETAEPATSGKANRV